MSCDDGLISIDDCDEPIVVVAGSDDDPIVFVDGDGSPVVLTDCPADIVVVVSCERGPAGPTGPEGPAAAGAVMEADTSTALMQFVIDEDSFASNLATKVPTQQSTKAYVDSVATLSQWTNDSPGIIYAGHIATGAQADVNGTGPFNSVLQGFFGVGTVSTVIGIEEVMTGTPAIYSNGLSVKVASNFVSQPTTIIAIEALAITDPASTNGAVILGGFFGGADHRGTGPVTFAYGLPSTVTNSAGGTIGNAFGLYSAVNNNSTGTITNGEGLHIANGANPGGGTYTTQYGIFVEAIVGATNSYGVAIGAATTNTLWVSHLSNPTTAAGGITFGSSKDTNLYRSAANTLKTDDAFVSATGIESTAIKPRVVTVSDATSITPNNDTSDVVYQANTQAAGTLTINAPSGTAYDGQILKLRIKSTNVQTFAFNAIYDGSVDTPLPISTYAGSTYMHMMFEYVTAHTLWHLVAVTDGY